MIENKIMSEIGKEFNRKPSRKGKAVRVATAGVLAAAGAVAAWVKGPDVIHGGIGAVQGAGQAVSEQFKPAEDYPLLGKPVDVEAKPRPLIFTNVYWPPNDIKQPFPRIEQPFARSAPSADAPVVPWASRQLENGTTGVGIVVHGRTDEGWGEVIREGNFSYRQWVAVELVNPGTGEFETVFPPGRFVKLTDTGNPELATYPTATPAATPTKK